jgi:hypothetical protein
MFSQTCFEVTQWLRFPRITPTRSNIHLNTGTFTTTTTTAKTERKSSKNIERMGPAASNAAKCVSNLADREARHTPDTIRNFVSDARREFCYKEAL